MTQIRYDAAEITTLHMVMVPIYAIILRRAFGVAEGALEG
jgi:hypothetical protein